MGKICELTKEKDYETHSNNDDILETRHDGICLEQKKVLCLSNVNL
jgi:hypothetical protein